LPRRRWSSPRPSDGPLSNGTLGSASRNDSGPSYSTLDLPSLARPLKPFSRLAEATVQMLVLTKSEARWWQK
jgi:hypothetical protein